MRVMNSRCVVERGQSERETEGWEEQERWRQRENTTPTQSQYQEEALLGL